MENRTLWLRTICSSNGLPVNDRQLELLSQYVLLLLEWNKKINLISRRDVENVWESHILHSISPLLELQLARNSAILDVGSGGGLPGIPLKILRPDNQMTLIDSTQKKITAVQDMIQRLGLKGTVAVWGRAEDVGKSSRFRGVYDYVVARAVAPLKDLVKWSSPFFKIREAALKSAESHHGHAVEPPALIALKGGDIEKETRHAKEAAGVKSVKVINLAFKGSEQLLESDKKIIVVQF